MFAQPLTLLAALATLGLATTAHAGVPVTVDLSEVQPHPGKLYISIQTEDQYMSVNGEGGIIDDVATKGPTVTYDIAEPGTYAVSLWHDLDGDGKFSMDERYRLIDGWGASGTVSASERPLFQDVAVEVPTYGTTVGVTMFYPE